MGLFSRKSSDPFDTPQGKRDAAADAERQAQEFRAKGETEKAEVCEDWAAKTRRAANDLDHY
ncbi:hypothetical protein DT019_03060 [Streptomyces sp. SDr-06]|uniref:hypothetical protein n=1 Tax=Streptomyces sp. SDr-06 TaxID=2267702 RepID=UPI000DEA150D|nr:hypothetical protein [Streptomyces sp. SDr-06]RCH70483.1 hypothetical protein DT019_03060 [Streptomyces sp. SDr-06]